MFVEPYLATVTIFGGNFAPRAWMFCQGQLLAISEYDALFALIGTTYGGDGQTTFALPDLRGRIAIHQGQGTGLSNYTLGQMSGTESVTLLSSNLAPHTHGVVSFTGQPTAVSTAGTSDNPTNNVPAGTGSTNVYSDNADGFGLGASHCLSSTVPAGSSQPFSILSPVLAMNYVIAVEGIFPSRN
jgi:microcystin-dependent protein